MREQPVVGGEGRTSHPAHPLRHTYTYIHLMFQCIYFNIFQPVGWQIGTIRGMEWVPRWTCKIFLKNWARIFFFQKILLLIDITSPGGGGNRNSESFKPFNRLRFLKTFLPVSYTTALWYFVIEEEFFVTEKDMFNLCSVSFLCEITYKHCIFCVDLKKECILEKVTLSPFWWCSHILKHFSHNI